MGGGGGRGVSGRGRVGGGLGGCEGRIGVFVKIQKKKFGGVGGGGVGGGGGGDKSFEPLPIILSEISHLQNCRVQN